MSVNNSIYNTYATEWWNENNFLFMLKTGINPARIGYFKNVINRLSLKPSTLKMLDVGCGGGFLSEEFALLGFSIVGMDLSTASVLTARLHSLAHGYEINFLGGSANFLPFTTSYFDLVIYCDVLEHLENFDDAMKEAARILKPKGLLLFDTINRTIQSYIENILVAQEMPFTRFFAPGTHEWRNFITPEQLKMSLNNHNLELVEVSGLEPAISKIQTLQEILSLNLGIINFAEFGRRLKFQLSDKLGGSYIGYAQKLG